MRGLKCLLLFLECLKSRSTYIPYIKYYLKEISFSNIIKSNTAKLISNEEKEQIRSLLGLPSSNNEPFHFHTIRDRRTIHVFILN